MFVSVLFYLPTDDAARESLTFKTKLVSELIKVSA